MNASLAVAEKPRDACCYHSACLRSGKAGYCFQRRPSVCLAISLPACAKAY